MTTPISWLASIQWTGGHCELGAIEAETYEQALGAAREKITGAVVMVRRQNVAAPNWERRQQLLDPTDVSGGGFSRFHGKKTKPKAAKNQAVEDGLDDELEESDD